MPALALTDHGSLFGAWHFHAQATKEGIKPILGMEAYVAPGDRRDRGRRAGGGRPYYHLVLLARDRTGYRNLVKLSSIGYTEGFYHKPRVDREVLAAHSEGIIVSSACLAGEVARRLRANEDDKAREAVEWYANTFPDRYYLEVQAHDSEGQADLNRRIFALASELGLPVVATNDAHFLRREDHEAHDILLCIGLGKDRSDTNRMRYDEGLYFKSAPEIRDRFPGHPEVLENTLRVADEVDLVLNRAHSLPRFPIPDRHADANEYLVHVATEGAKERFGDPLPSEAGDRLTYELEVIGRTGYAGYFLICWDFIRWARERAIPVGPGRGSAAGSLVAYSLRITNIDPLAFDLLFERFLNPERISLPDIDIDFCFERRGEVIDYVREKYGREAVGQIITFGTMKSRAVIKDVGRALGFEPGETDRIAKLIPNAPGQAYTVREAIVSLPEVRTLYEMDERHRQLFDYSTTLEGLSRHASVHAAGVVIAPGPLDEYVPVCIPPRKGGSASNGARSAGEGAGGRAAAPAARQGPTVVTQYDMNCLEDAGMLKMDFLGLKTLTVIHEAVAMVKEKAGRLAHPSSGTVYGSMDDVPIDDPDVFAMLARGGTAGVFQFESSLAADKLRAMKCDRFEDLVATNALIRPGPLDTGMSDVYIRRKTGREKVEYAHPDLESVLEPTYGVIVYQEQVMRIANVLGGFTLAEADVLRKAVGKKIPELIRKELDRFMERAVERGAKRRVVRELANQIETFGRYGFNRSHSAAYSLLSYHTAWLKYHHPAEFMAALLSSVLSSTDDVVKYIAECRELGRSIRRLPEGIEVLPPDVNESGWKFTVVDEGRIRFGLGAVRGLGSSAVQSIIRARGGDGPFRSFFEFLERVDLRILSKRAVEALICAGALDPLGHRAQLWEGLDLGYGEAQAREAEKTAGQASLFGGEEAALKRFDPTLPDIPEWTDSERLKQEKEALGFFISGHPLDRFGQVVKAFGPAHTGNLKDHLGRSVEIPCVVTTVSSRISRRDQSEWGMITVEDFSGTARVIAFKDAWRECGGVLAQDEPILVRGKVSSREGDEEDPPLFLDSARPLAGIAQSGEIALLIELETGSDIPSNAFSRMREVLQRHPGVAPVEVTVGPGNGENAPRLRSASLRVDPGESTLRELRNILGVGRVRLTRARTASERSVQSRRG